MIDHDFFDNCALGDASAEARAKRLRYVRNLANLSREDFCTKGSTTINIHTLVGWENTRFGGLTKIGAEKIIARLGEVGVICSLEWLLDGTKEPPIIDHEYIKIMNKEARSIDVESEEQIIARELALFKAKNKKSIGFLVCDDTMLPQYHEGDYVAGIKYLEDEIESTIGLDCIVETSNKEIYLRNIRPGQSKGFYTLVCSNRKSTQKDAIIFNIKLNSVAPVLWHRKTSLLKR